MNTAAFPRHRRLTCKSDFRRVFATGQRFAGDYLVVAIDHHNEQTSRLGLAIGKRHCRQAVERNRIKRVIREWFRHHYMLLCGLDMVYLARSTVSSAPNHSLREDLEKLGHRIKRYQRLHFAGQRND